MMFEVHPAADVWPMMADDEIDALAADIKANGLIHPLVVTPKGELLDGRNRFAACARAGVEPATVVYDGDPVAYVLSANNHRRHITKGQRAMAGVLALGNGSLKIKDVKAAGMIGVTGGMVSWARTVTAEAPDLVPLVVAGSTSLKDAYDEAKNRSKAAASAESRFAKLPTDFADLVRDERMTLEEAEAAANERQRRLIDQRRDARALLTRVVDLVAPDDPSPDFVEAWATHLGEVEPDFVERIDAAIATLTDLAKRVRS
jgi:hypothetical protein